MYIFIYRMRMMTSFDDFQLAPNETAASIAAERLRDRGNWSIDRSMKNPDFCKGRMEVVLVAIGIEKFCSRCFEYF